MEDTKAPQKTMSLSAALFSHSVLLVACIIVLYPLLYVIRMALSPTQGFTLGLDLSSGFSLQNFAYVTGTHDQDGGWLFGRQLWNSLWVSLASTLVGVVLAVSAAYAFSRFRFPGRKESLMAFLVTQMFPGTMMMIPLYILLDTLGLLDQSMGLILVYATTSLPFCVWMLKGYFDTIPKDLEEAALIDGASRFQIFWRVILPLARPAIAVTALFSFMTSWNEFVLAKTFMTREVLYTLPVVLRGYVGKEDVQWGFFAAGAILVSVPVMVLFFALQKQLISGLTTGAVKG
jgi:arabinogalactan oligomer / maltooligosaccharide transport system permease protein